MGRLDVDALMTELSVDAFDGWQAWLALRPQHRQAEMLARVCATLVNGHGGWQGGRKARPSDFLEIVLPDAPQQAPSDMVQVLNQAAAGLKAAAEDRRPRGEGRRPKTDDRRPQRRRGTHG